MPPLDSAILMYNDIFVNYFYVFDSVKYFGEDIKKKTVDVIINLKNINNKGRSSYEYDIIFLFNFRKKF